MGSGSWTDCDGDVDRCGFGAFSDEEILEVEVVMGEKGRGGVDFLRRLW